jgi:hypothetical protein
LASILSISERSAPTMSAAAPVVWIVSVFVISMFSAGVAARGGQRLEDRVERRAVVVDRVDDDDAADARLAADFDDGARLKRVGRHGAEEGAEAQLVGEHGAGRRVRHDGHVEDLGDERGGLRLGRRGGADNAEHLVLVAQRQRGAHRRLLLGLRVERQQHERFGRQQSAGAIDFFHGEPSSCRSKRFD